ncbi:hypothetical protein AB0N17_45710 [Streptomyces sp. NPDC051133]|uniref:hypothetical protein n=1 Tax=Streptomyces sp. NPDC051133 TaxID=3155521 RepID=UPI0034140C78
MQFVNNPTCINFPASFAFEVNVVPPAAGSTTTTFPAPHNDGSVTTTLHRSTRGPLLDFHVHGPYAAHGVIVRGAVNAASFYGYEGIPVRADQRFHAPISPITHQFEPIQIIHFCLVSNHRKGGV